MVQAYGLPLSLPTFLTFHLNYEIMRTSLEHHLLGSLEIVPNMNKRWYKNLKSFKMESCLIPI